MSDCASPDPNRMDWLYGPAGPEHYAKMSKSNIPDVSDRMANNMSYSMSDNMSEYVSEFMSNRMTDRISDLMPDNTQDKMADRMSEDKGSARIR